MGYTSSQLAVCVRGIFENIGESQKKVQEGKEKKSIGSYLKRDLCFQYLQGRNKRKEEKKPKRMGEVKYWEHFWWAPVHFESCQQGIQLQ